MKRLLNISLAVVAMALTLHGPLQAQQDVFFQPASSPASWGVGTNWSNYGQGQNVPEGQFNEVAVINTGAIAQVTSSFPVGTGGEVNGPGGLRVLNGTLEIQNSGLLGFSVPDINPTANRSVIINDKLNIQGGGRLLNASTITFGSASNYNLDLTASTVSSPIVATGAANLAGTLDLDFSAISASGTYTLLSAASLSGDFSSINSTGLGVGKQLAVSKSGGVLSASVFNVPILTINRETGTASIHNPHGTPLSLDGFSIRSGLNAMNSANFTGLPRTGWEFAGGNSSSLVADTFEGPNAATQSDSLPSTTPHAVGSAGFWSLPAPQAFLQETEELIFEVTDESYGQNPVRGIVNYTGAKVINNNIVLTINSAGQAVMLNQSPFAQEVEVYRISSSASPLQTDTWDPLQDQAGLDNDTWQVSAQSGTGKLLEVTEVGSSTFDGDTIYEIGQILDPGYTQSGITFEFLLAGDDQFTTGVVVFGNLPTVVDGDFDNDGDVDGRDFLIWQRTDKTPAGLAAWQAAYGAPLTANSTAATEAVPEPTGLLLAGCFLAAAGGVRRRSC